MDTQVTNGTGVPSWLVNSKESSQVAENKNSSTQQGVLGKDAFLKILLTQLRYQNPLEPVKDTDFIAQMAQFGSLEQMQNMNKNLEASLQAMKSMEESSIRATNIGHAIGLIGREVEYQVGNEFQKGVVSAVKTGGGIPKLLIGDNEVTLETISRIQPVEVDKGEETDEQ